MGFASTRGRAYLARVVPGPGVTADKLMGRTTDLKLRLGLPHTFDIRTYADRGAVVFEVPKLDEERYDVMHRLSGSGRRFPRASSVPIGEDIAGHAVVVNFSSSDSPHLLVAGTTGSGKSVALETILRGLCRSKMPGSSGFIDRSQRHRTRRIEDDDHLDGDIGLDASDAIAALSRAVDEMQMRYEVFRPPRVRDLHSYNNTVTPGDRLPWRLIVLDEYGDLTADPDDRDSSRPFCGGSRKRRVLRGCTSSSQHSVPAPMSSARSCAEICRHNSPSASEPGQIVGWSSTKAAQRHSPVEATPF